MSDAAQGSRVGSQFGPYHLQRLLGRGGMGEVYEAEDTVKERVVALKLLSTALSQDPVFRERLQREARIAGRLQDPHVVPIHDYGEIDGQLFLDMRLIRGIDLSVLLKQFGALPPARAVDIVHQAASALDAAHAAGVTHRDIKPENILITGDDFVYLVDFGIASATTDERLTQMGSAVGTWRYSAPERFNNAEVTPRADVYSLACVLHECLTGASPYRADSAGMLITAHLMEPVPRPSAQAPGIPAAFDAVIARGMAKNPEDRYASAGELAQAAYQALHTPDPVPPAPSFQPPPVAAPPPIAAPAPAHPAPPQFATPGGHSGVPPAVGGGLPRIQPTLRPQPRPFARRHNIDPRLAIGAGALALVVLLGIWLFNRPHDVEPVASDTSTTQPDPEAQARLTKLLPAGYPPNACQPATVPAGALAAVSCGQNNDPEGPASATYTLYADHAALREGFNNQVSASAVVNCPGGIQSPGPWYHAANPKEATGMLLCGTQQSRPTVVWTNDAALVVNSVQSGPNGPSLDRLYRWWSTHS